MTTTRRPLLATAALLLAAGCTLTNDPTKLEPGPDLAGPPPPAGLAATPGIAKMALRWDAVTAWDLHHYVVYYAPTTQSLMKFGETAATSVDVTGLDNAVVYDFMVLAVDRFGNVSAPSDTVTAQPDGVAPTVGVAYNPGPQNPADLMTDVIFTFSEPMNRASVEGSATVTSNATATPACVWSWYSGDTEAKCDLVVGGNPATPFEFSKTYTVTLAAGPTDVAGNALAGTPVVASFTTAGIPDTTPPSVSSVTVSNYQSAAQPVGAGSPGAIGVFPETSVVIAFSEPMAPVATAGAVSVTAGPGYNGGVKSWDATGKILTFNPDVNYANGQTVTVAIAAGATDAAGNPLPAFASRTFRTAYSASATLESDPARDGYAYSNGVSVTVVSSGSYVAVGDSSLNYQYKGFLSFNRSGLSPAPSRFTAATLAADQYLVSGTPYDDLDRLVRCYVILGGVYCIVDDLLAQHVSLDGAGVAGLDAADFTSAALDGAVELATSAALGYWSVNVLTMVEGDRVAGRARSEWRLEFPVATDSDAVTDLAYFYSGEAAAGTRPTLTLTYEYP
jgi:hypothetical protein